MWSSQLSPEVEMKKVRSEVKKPSRYRPVQSSYDSTVLSVTHQESAQQWCFESALKVTNVMSDSVK